MTHRIIVFNHGDYWRPNARESVQAAAARWDAVVCETDPGPDWFGAKFELGDRGGFPGDRYLYVDADVVIRSDCPSPFVLVRPENFGGVLNFQVDTHEGRPEHYHLPAWERAKNALGVHAPVYSPDRFINGGFLVWTCARDHNRVFEFNRTRLGARPGPEMEQAALNVSLDAFGVPLTILPHKYNRIGPSVWGHDGTMHSYVYHFANHLGNRGAKAAAIDALAWDI